MDNTTELSTISPEKTNPMKITMLVMLGAVVIVVLYTMIGKKFLLDVS